MLFLPFQIQIVWQKAFLRIRSLNCDLWISICAAVPSSSAESALGGAEKPAGRSTVLSFVPAAPLGSPNKVHTEGE